MLNCGLLNSPPSEDRPVTWMKLNPKSAFLVAKSGKPTLRFRLVPLFSWRVVLSMWL